MEDARDEGEFSSSIPDDTDLESFVVEIQKTRGRCLVVWWSLCG